MIYRITKLPTIKQPAFETFLVSRTEGFVAGKPFNGTRDGSKAFRGGILLTIEGSIAITSTARYLIERI